MQWSRNRKRIGAGKEFVSAVIHGCKAAVRGRVREGDVPPPARSAEAHAVHF